MNDHEIALEVMKKNPAFRKQWLRVAEEKLRLDKLWEQMIKEQEKENSRD